MNKNEAITKVVFRKYKDGDIVALFPYEKYDRAGLYCFCYAHIGQHSGVDYYGCIKPTVLATPEEYADLKRELESIGYNLQVIKKKS